MRFKKGNNIKYVIKLQHPGDKSGGPKVYARGIPTSVDFKVNKATLFGVEMFCLTADGYGSREAGGEHGNGAIYIESGDVLPQQLEQIKEAWLKRVDSADVLTKTQIRLLKHALGNETEYRNYFYTTKDTADYPELCKLVDLRLMEKNQSTDKADTFIFHVTHLGKINVRAAWDWGEEDE